LSKNKYYHNADFHKAVLIVWLMLTLWLCGISCVVAL